MNGPLYRTEAEIARDVLGKDRLEAWRGIAVVLEREGLPKVNPLMGGRYWPAVKAWLDAHERVDRIAGATPLRHGREKWPTTSAPQGSTGAHEKPDNVRRIGARQPTT